MVTILLNHGNGKSSSMWATRKGSLEALAELAALLKGRINLLRLRGRTDGFSIVDEKAEKAARIVITPSTKMAEPDQGGEVAVRFLGETEYYTFEQVADLFMVTPESIVP